MVDRVKTRVELEGAEAYAQKAQKATKSVKALNKEGNESASLFDLAKAEYLAAGVALGSLAAAASTAANYVRIVGQAIYDLGMRGGDVSAVATAFERIASPRLLSQLREATGGLSRGLDLMRESTQALRAGLVTEDEIGRWYRAVTRGAQDTGESVEDLQRALGTMLTTGEMEEVLGKLGVSVTNVREEVAAAGETMETVRGKSLALSLALNQLEMSTSNVDNSAGNLNDIFTQLTVSATNLHDEFARGFSESSRMRDVFRGLNQELLSGRGNWQAYGSVMGSVIANGIQRVLRFAAAVNDLNAAIFRILRIEWEGGSAEQTFEQWAERFREIAGAMEPEAIAPGITQTGGASGTGAPKTRQETPPPRTRRGGGRRPLPRGADTGEFMAEATAAIMAERQAAVEGETKAYQEQLRVVREIYEAQREALRETFDGIDSENERRERLHERNLERVQEQREAAAKAFQEQIRQEEERRERIVGNMQSLAQGASMLGEIFQEIADNQEQNTKRADAWRKIVGVAKGTYYAIEAVAAAAEAAKQGASQNYAGMALGIIAAIKYGVASGYMFSKLAEGGGGAGIAASSAGTFVPTQPDRVAPPTQVERGPERVVVLGLGNTDAGVAAAVYRANRELVRSGRTPVGTSKGVGYMG